MRTGQLEASRAWDDRPEELKQGQRICDLDFDPDGLDCVQITLIIGFKHVEFESVAAL